MIKFEFYVMRSIFNIPTLFIRFQNDTVQEKNRLFFKPKKKIMP